MDLCFVDIETTGLDPTKHEIIEVAAIRVDGRTLKEIACDSVRIAPQHIENALPAALEINGYNAATWGGTNPASALRRIAPMLDCANPAGHNAAIFDVPFVFAEFDRAGIKRPDMSYRVLDTQSLCWPLLVRGEVKSLSLSALCDHFGISNEGAHGALADCRRALAVARAMILGVKP